MSGRFRIVSVLLVAGGLFLGYLLVDRMVVNKKTYATSRYIDKKFVEVVSRLDRAGAFVVDGRLVRINEDVLEEKGFHKGTVEKIRQAVNSGAIHAARGEVVFNSRFCARANPKKEEIVWRGAFLDRNGVALTKTTVSEKLFSVKREYPFGREFSSIIGHFHDIYGTRNLEKELDRYVTGKTHSPIYHDENNPLKRIALGDDVFLTMDSGLQRYGYGLMGETKGAIAVLDARTGEVLAAVSTPSYDPNTKDRQQWNMISDDRIEKLYENRVFSVLYPLGSTFKTVVTVTWLDTSSKGDGRDGFSVFCTGRPNQYKIADEYKEHGHGTVNLEKGLIQSCNPFFSELGVALGPSLYEYAVKFGFNSPINLMPQIEGHTFLATRSLAFSHYEYSGGDKTLHTYTKADFRRNKGVVAQCAIGQNLVSATPVQMAVVAATIANGGRLFNPYVVREIRTARGEKTMTGSGPVAAGGRVMSDSTARTVRDLMRRVMLEGTGKNVKKLYFENGTYTTEPTGPGAVVVHVAGKTGTAETGRDEKAHSWFIGFAPADNPQVAIAVIVENGGKGGAVAAPKAVDMIARALNGLARKVGS
jgi:peptidoglycan glycosyltransferase